MYMNARSGPIEVSVFIKNEYNYIVAKTQESILNKYCQSWISFYNFEKVKHLQWSKMFILMVLYIDSDRQSEWK